MERTKLLLVDDEPAIVHMLELVLRKEGFRLIEHASTGSDAIRICRRFQPDFIVLDVMLPDLEGFEVCRQLRMTTDAPVLFLTARSSDLDKLTGFGIGGDDYVTKPFNPLEVAARIKAQLRRRQAHLAPLQDRTADDPPYDFGRFLLYEQAGQLIVDDAPVVCPAKEFQLLLFLCKRPNRIFSRSQLYELVWGEESLSDDNTVIVHIRRLREKIEADPGNPQLLVTVRGLGYKLVPPRGSGGAP